MNIRVLVSSGLLALGLALGPQALAKKPAAPADEKAAVPNASAKTGTPAAEAAKMKGTADLKGADGKTVGTATLQETPHGVLITVELAAAPAGEHAFHIHETGKCEAPGFKSAGGHFNPEHRKHGIMADEGKHAGDLPNVFVDASGKAKFSVLVPDVTLAAGKANSLMDADGSAIVMHAKADDNAGDPAGNAGDRVACGVVTAAK